MTTSEQAEHQYREIELVGGPHDGGKWKLRCMKDDVEDGEVGVLDELFDTGTFIASAYRQRRGNPNKYDFHSQTAWRWDDEHGS